MDSNHYEPDWIGWIALSCVGLGWVGMESGLGNAGLDGIALEWIAVIGVALGGKDRIRLHWTELDWIESDGTTLEWILLAG